MDKKTTDIINNIDIPNIFEEINLDDKEINKILENKDIDYLKIKNNILNNISEYNNFNKINTKKRLFLRNIKPLVAAILIICLSCSVYAYNKGYLEEYFGKNSEKINEGRVHIELNQELDGIVLKSADVISGETDANILLAFQKKDGKPFKGIPSIKYDIKLSGKISCGGSSSKMSSDNTTMTTLIEIRGDNKPLKGRTVDINIDGMIIRNFNSNEYVCDSDLYKLYKNNPINVTMSNEDKKIEEKNLKKKLKKMMRNFI